MKKNIFAIVAILFAGFAFSSCSSDKDEPEISRAEELLRLPYSTLQVADQKKKLSAEAEVVMKSMEGLTTDKSVKLLASFNEINSGLFDLLESPSADANLLKSIVKLSSYFGEYTWDAATEEWVKSDKVVADKLVLLFPAVKGAATNDGKIEVKAITSTVIINGREIPSNVVADLFVSDKKEGVITAIATGINESTFVETADVVATLGAYKLVVDVDKKGAKNEAKMQFTKDNGVILDAAANLEANITAAMLENEDVSSVSDGNFVATVTNNLAGAGYVDGKTLAPILKKIEDAQEAVYGNYDYYDGKEGEREAKYLALEQEKIAAMNAYSNLGLVSTTETYKVAKVAFELFVEKRERTAQIKEKNEAGETIYKDYKYTAYDTEEIIVLYFNDNTKVTADVFFGTGFDKIFNMWNEFVGKFN